MISGRPRQGGLPTAGELAEDVTTVRAAYWAVEAGDQQALTRYLDPRIEWVHPAVTRLPFDGILRGLPAVLRSAFRRNEDGTGPRVSADTFLEIGDGVLVAGRFLETGRQETGEPFLHECSVRGGRVERIREYPAQP
jgi:ketosteroid isomerase-like protein